MQNMMNDGFKIEIISSIGNDQCSYITDFIDALQNVDEKYYTYTTLKNDTKYPERVFAYELYHQFRIIMEKKSDVYDDIYLNGEQTKSKEVVENLERCAPDLVLHKRLYDYKPEDQLWLCEIKMNGNQNAMSDLNKFYEMEPLNFQHYIFLYAGVKYVDMEKEIKGIKIKKDTNIYEKIICISSYNWNNVKQIHCHALKDIIDGY